MPSTPRPVKYCRRYSHGGLVDAVVIRTTSGSRIEEETRRMDDGGLIETTIYSTRPRRVEYAAPAEWAPDEPRPFVRTPWGRCYIDDLMINDYGSATRGAVRWSGSFAYVAAHADTFFSAYLCDRTYEQTDGEYARIGFSMC